jgi:LuxR family maltose regulon positive regulatory protein
LGFAEYWLHLTAGQALITQSASASYRYNAAFDRRQDIGASCRTVDKERPSPPWLAQTKFFPPLRRGDLIPRPSLLAALTAAVAAHTLTLISAPAGYGKTTLLADFRCQMSDVGFEWTGDDQIGNWQGPNLRGPLSTICKQAAWLSLDEEDNDPARFLAALAQALRTLQPDRGEIAGGLLWEAPNPTLQVREWVAGLINAIIGSLPQPFALVVDDLHLITEPAMYVALSYLLERAPPHLRLVIGTRHDPPLPLARLRARGQLAELRMVDLRFTAGETAQLLNDRLRLGLAAPDLAALYERTEGWPAGLRLLAGSLEQIPNAAGRSAFIRDLAHTDRYVFDFLAEEVLERQEPAVRAFMLEISILNELTPARCHALTGRGDAGAILEELYRRNLFLVNLPSPTSQFTTYQSTNQPTYRYHALFAEFLRRRLAQELPERVRALHRRAAESQPDPSRAIWHYLAAEMWGAAATRIEQIGAALLRQGLLATVNGWINVLPAAVRQSRAGLTHLLGVCAWLRGEPLVAIGFLEQALAQFEAAGDEAGQIMALTDLVPPLVMSARYGRVHEVSQHALAQRIGPASRVQLLMVRGIAEVTQDNCAAAQAHLEQALAITEAANDAETWAAQAIHCVSQFTVLPGAIDLVEHICAEATRRLGGQATPASMAAAARYTLVHLLRGRPAEAIRAAELALALGEQLGSVSYLGGEATWALAQTYLSLGDYAAAAATLDQAHAFFLQFPHGEAALGALFYLRGMMAYHQGNQGELEHWLDQMRTTRIPGEWGMVETLRELLAAVAAIAAVRYDEAEALLRRVAHHQARIPTSARFGSGRSLLAHLRLRQGRDVDALAEFGGLLAVCERQGMPGRALLEGAAAVPLLRLAVARGVHGSLAGRLLAALGHGDEPQAVFVPDTGETLTPREIEVLRLLTAGASNQQIAGRLCISEQTVKTHVSHILGKLNVTSRGQAAARARELTPDL